MNPVDPAEAGQANGAQHPSSANVSPAAVESAVVGYYTPQVRVVYRHHRPSIITGVLWHLLALIVFAGLAVVMGMTLLELADQLNRDIGLWLLAIVIAAAAVCQCGSNFRFMRGAYHGVRVRRMP